MAWLVGVLVLIVGVGAAVLYVLWRSVDPDQDAAPGASDRTLRTTTGHRERGAASSPAPVAPRADTDAAGAPTAAPRDEAGDGTGDEEADADSGLELFALVSADQQDERSGHLAADLRRRAGERVHRGQRDRDTATDPAAADPAASEPTAAVVPPARSGSAAPVRRDASGAEEPAGEREAPADPTAQDKPSVERAEESRVDEGRDEQSGAEEEPQIVTPVAMADDEVWDRILAMVRGEGGS